MNKKPKLFTPTHAYGLIHAMLEGVDIHIPRQLIGAGQSLKCPMEHVDIYVKREETGIPYIAICTNSERPTTLLSVKFADADVTLDIHPHSKTDVMALPTDFSLLNAMQLYYTMQKETQSYFFEKLGAKSFHEVFAPVRRDRQLARTIARRLVKAG